LWRRVGLEFLGSGSQKGGLGRKKKPLQTWEGLLMKRFRLKIFIQWRIIEANNTTYIK